MIEKIDFHHEPEYDKAFPKQRLSRAEIVTKDGKRFVSSAIEPRGDYNAAVSIDDISEKIRKMNILFAESGYVDALIDGVLGTPLNMPFEIILSKIRVLAKRNIHPEIEFI